MARGRKIAAWIGRYIIIIIICLLAIFPIYWMLATSFKPAPEWTASPPYWIPSNPTIDNYLVIMLPQEKLPSMLQMGEAATKAIINSLIISIGATALAIVVGMFYAYGLSRYRAAGQGSFFFILMFRMIPPVAIVIPLLIAYATLKLIDTHLGMILLYGAVTLPYVIWLMKSFFDEIPREIDEAAILDGCSLFGAFFKGIMPLARAGIAVAALFVFILDWSEFFSALVITRSAATTLPVRMASMNTAMGVLYGPLAAVGVIAIIPPLIFGVLIQKYLVRGFTFGAIKGR